jgi:hypothetical protein
MRGRMMRTSLHQKQPLILLRCRDQLRDHEHKNYVIENILLPNDLIVIRNQGVDHGGQVGHREGAGDPRRHAQQGGGPNQFGVQESDFDSNSESRTTLPLN